MNAYELIFIIPSLSMLIGTIGVVRFKKFMMKMQSATMITVGGVMFSLLIFSFYAPSFQLKMKTLFLLSIMFITSPVSSHFIARCYFQTEECDGRKRRR